MAQIKMGIVGLGVMGNRMVQAIERFQLHEQIAVTAVCDVNEKVASDFAVQYGVKNWTNDAHVIMKNTEIDLLYIAAPPAFHYSLVREAFQHGKHVLCEKPLANSVDEAAQMLDMAQESGLVHAINFPLNYGPALRQFARLIESGYIGNVRRIRLDMHFPHWPRAWQQNAWISSRKQGGFILEVGVHWIQAIQKIFGKITHVQSDVRFPSNPEECENSITANLLLDDGTPVTIDGISGISGKEKIALVVYGTEGTLAIENWGELYGGKVNQPLERISFNDLPPNRSLLENVALAMNGQDAEIYDFSVGYDAQIVLEALRNPSSTEWQDLRPLWRY